MLDLTIQYKVVGGRFWSWTQILNISFDDQTIFYESYKWRWPQMEDNFKILNAEYLSNHLLDHSAILNLSSGDQTKNAWKEDNL